MFQILTKIREKLFAFILVLNLDLNIKLQDMIDLTRGMSGAEIENMINEACLKNLRDDKLPVTT